MAQVEWFRVDPGQSIQVAINAAAAANGGIVYLAPGDHLVPGLDETATGLELPYPWTPPLPPDWFYTPLKPISIIGDGPGTTIIKRRTSSPNFTTGPLLKCRRPFSTISGLTIDGAGLTSGAVVEVAGAAGEVRRINFRDCIIKGGPAQALKIIGKPTPICIHNSFDRCVFANNGLIALIEIQAGITSQEFRSCHFTAFKGNALRLSECAGVSLYDCLFDSAADSGLEAFLLSDRASACQVFDCVFDEGTTPVVSGRRWFIDLYPGLKTGTPGSEVNGPGSNGWTISGCQFIRRSTFNTLAQAIRVGRLNDGSCYGVVIIDPLIRMPSGIAPGAPGLHIDIQNRITADPPDLSQYSQCVVIGGHCEVGDPPATTRYPLDVTDGSVKTAWIGHRRWRVPQVTMDESQEPGQAPSRVGDLTSRSSRGLEAYTESVTPGPGWIPITVNRYANQAALNAVSPLSINLGSLAWVDDEGVLKVCASVSPLVWRKVSIA